MENENFLEDYSNVEEIDNGNDYESVPTLSIFDSEEEIPQELANTVKEDVKPSNVLTELLKDKGIPDPAQIKFENEDGEEERVNFYDLPVDEQLSILRSNVEEDQNDLDDTEVTFINYLRQNQLTPDEFMDHIKKQAINDYLTDQLPLDAVESMSDDEIFLTDLLTRIPDITDDEATEALELERQNEQIYLKKVNALRSDLLRKEEMRKQEEVELEEEERKQSLETFKQSLFDTAPTVKEIAGRIELDDEDINDTVNFLLSEDATGTRYIAKALNDPASLIKMAWFYIKGEEAIDYMGTYYENQIKEFSKSNYEKGYEDGKNGIQPTKRVAAKPKQNSQPRFEMTPKNPALTT